MLDFVGSVWWLIVALGVLISFHEFGHFWVARLCGVKVLRFSIGFGSPLWRRRDRHGTEFVVAAIPLGGYVKMLDEREAPVADSELDQAFNRKSLGARTAIVAAGPVFNLVLAFFVFSLMFLVGVREFRALIGEPTGIALRAGIKPLDQIVAVDGAATRSLTHVNISLLAFALDRKPVQIELENVDGDRRKVTLDLSQLTDDFNEERLLEAAGLGIYRPAAVVHAATPDGPADRSGMRNGDRVVAINGEPVKYGSQLPGIIQEQAKEHVQLAVQIERAGSLLSLTMTPDLVGDEESRRFIIGIEMRDPQVDRLFAVVSYGPLDAMSAALAESYQITAVTLGLLRRIVSGKASLKNLSGPITIAQIARDSARLGVSQFLRFLGLLSLSLAILNFLPIPLLDGGHLLYFLVEWIKGSPVSEQTQLIGQYLGLFALVALMSLTFYNDILRLMS